MSSNGGNVARNIGVRAKMMSGGIDAATKKTATFVRTEAARTTPVLTGNLRKGWQGPVGVGKWAYEVKNEVEYAMFVELGTWKMAGRHMLGNAVHKAEPMHRAAIHAIIRKALG